MSEGHVQGIVYFPLEIEINTTRPSLPPAVL